MKKNILFFLLSLLLLVNINVWSDDEAVEFSPYVEIEQTTGIIAENDDSLPKFVGVENETVLNAGFGIEFNNYFALKPFVENVIAWPIDALGVPAFESDELTFGIAGIFTPVELLTIEIMIGNVEEFPADDIIWAGIKSNLMFNLNIEKAFLEIEVSDTLKSVFQLQHTDSKVNTSLVNELESSIVFNFFNFINEDLNTGIFIEDTLETASSFNSDREYEETALGNELFVGISTNPVEFFTALIAFAMFNEVTFDEDSNFVEDSKVLDIGLKVGLEFLHQWFSFGARVCPRR